MGMFKNSGLAMCLSVATMIGACGSDDGVDRDALGDEDVDDDTRSSGSGRSASGGGSLNDAGARSGDAGVSADAGSGSTSDAGASAPATGLDLDVGQDTPNEPATRFEFVVNRAQETPACDAGKDSALGAGRVIIADSGKWVEVTVGSKFMSGLATNAHVHFGARGAAGPIVLDFGKLPAADIFFKRFTEADFPKQRPATAPANFPADFSAFVKALQAGNAYVNVHTAACKTGEIRGQIQE